MTATVLLVEDDPLSLKLMRDALQAHGFTTGAVMDGTGVLDAVLAQLPSLVVMDIGLPGMDGVDAMKQLRSHPATRRLPIVAVTAYAMPEDELRVRDAGCDAFLTKPLVLLDLVAVVRGLIGESGEG